MEKFKKAIAGLRAVEYTMGNGQCVRCYGRCPTFGEHSSFGIEFDKVGHEKDCPLAYALVAMGDTEVVYKGDLKGN